MIVPWLQTKMRVEKERAYRKQLQSEKELLLQQQAKLEQARARLYSRGTIHEAYRSLIPDGVFPPLSLNGHYEHTGRKMKGCYDRFDEDSWRHAVLTNFTAGSTRTAKAAAGQIRGPIS